jgi:hypothetical protein
MHSSVTDGMDTTSNRLVQEKPASTTKASTASRRSASPTNETKGNNKKLRPSGNTDVREWDLPKFQQDEEKMSTERHVVEEPAGTDTKHETFSLFSSIRGFLNR